MNSSRTSARPLGLALALGLGLAAGGLGAAAPASARTAAAPTAPTTSAGASVARYDGSGEEAADNKAFFEAVLKSVAAKRAAQPNAQAVTITYDDSRAPSFRSQIASAASIWNSSESHVRLQKASSGGADFSYYEGNDQRGSYASTNGHGSGYIFIDYTQSRQYDSVRVVAHETGHVLGLQDDYSGPCSELMSGGGAGPSCTNRYPNAAERSRVDQLWATGAAQAPGTTANQQPTTQQPTGRQPSIQPGITQPGTVQPGTVQQVPTLVMPGQGPWRVLLGLPWS
ncbi:snapalysin [Streptomyces sp. NPDC047061]|uniref:snapalysin n=1 Tax=Streptomyces sp. NPDC047061 TaxID=3154605 RepID=UPI00340149AA